MKIHVKSKGIKNYGFQKKGLSLGGLHICKSRFFREREAGVEPVTLSLEG